MRLIDADALGKKLPLAGKRVFGGGNYERIYGGIQIHNSIDNMPTIDAVPVVRCKDCKHRGRDACPICFDFDEYDENCGYECRVIDRTEDDGHCHKGEKEGNHAAD